MSIQRFVSGLQRAVVVCFAVLPLCAWAAATPTNAPAGALPEMGTNRFEPLAPVDPVDGRIAWVTAKMLEIYQYSQKPLDDAMSSRFLDQYLNMLDPQHLHFTQQDLAEFETYRTNLDRVTLPSRGVSDTQPAFEIFNRFMLRLQQRVAYAETLLKNEKFSFDTDERMLANRKDAPYPRDLAEAQQLWRERVRGDFLLEKLGRTNLTVKAEAPAAKGAQLLGSHKAAAPEGDSDIVGVLSHRYHRTMHMFEEWSHDEVLELYLTALAHSYDPHSDYMGHSQLEGFSISMNLSLFGIGAELSSDDSGYCTIRRLLPGGPAMKSKKLHEKDRIVAVAQSNLPPVDVVDMNLNKAVQMIRGPKGTEVRLTIIPAGADSSSRTVVTLVRDEIPLEDQAAKARIIDMPDASGQIHRLGVIDLPSFYAPFDATGSRHQEMAHTGEESAATKGTTADVARLLAKLKQEHVQGVILDLRRNGGGSLEEAIHLTGLFIKEGPVVQVRATGGRIEVDEDTDPAMLYEGPLIVLTSRFSASASEILAGALQDYGRALIVGDISTHGKGTVQMVNPLKPAMQLPDRLMTNDPGALKVTIKKFYRPSGASTQLKGVVSDLVLPSILNEAKDIGEGALDNPLPWDTIRSAKFEHFNRVAAYLPELRKRSAARVADDKEFSYVREDIEIFKKQQADKTISLNEKVRLKEKEEADARQKARDKERASRPPLKETVYEISLKQAALPGLPAPVAHTNAVLAKVSGAKEPGAVETVTNAVSEAPPASARNSVLDEELADEDKPPAVDASLQETERILMDYIALLPGSVLTATATPAGH